MHHKPFGSRAPPKPAVELTVLPGPLARFRGYAPERRREGRGKGSEIKEVGKGKEK